MSPGALYISYDGMLEPLGQSQVLAYLERLSPGRQIHLISFEKPADWGSAAKRAAMARRIAAAGIEWNPLHYHKRPSALATAYDVTVGAAKAIGLVRRRGLQIVHARSYVAALIALAVKRICGAAFLFDMRGFWANERVDGGLWPANGGLYRATKMLERRFLLAADEVVTLTHASRREIEGFPFLAGRIPPITVIPTCADLERFDIQEGRPAELFVLGYVGSVGTWYLLDEMLRFFLALRQQLGDARLLIANRSEQQMIRERAAAIGIEQKSMEIVSADHDDMPAVIGRMSAGMALIKPVYSKIASAPTKLAEYLGCGVPCLGNHGVGDMAEILEGRRVGISMPAFAHTDVESAAKRLIALTREPDVRRRCRGVAEELFSVDGGTAAYAAIYERLGSGPHSSPKAIS